MPSDPYSSTYHSTQSDALMCQVALPEHRFLNTIADSQLLVVRHRQQLGSMINHKCNLCKVDPAQIYVILLQIVRERKLRDLWVLWSEQTFVRTPRERA